MFMAARVYIIEQQRKPYKLIQVLGVLAFLAASMKLGHIL